MKTTTWASMAAGGLSVSMTPPLRAWWAAALVMALGGPATAQVFKCTVEGATVYQARPCATAGGTGQEVKLHVAPAAPAAAPATPPPAAKPAPPPPAAEPTPSPGATTIASPKPWLEAEADACLAWYRPKLRDPRSAYHRNPTKDGRVLTLTLHATNAFGGYLTKSAACEMKGGEVDDGWTKIHAERLGWALERCGQVPTPMAPLGTTLPQVGQVHRGRQGAAESMLLGCEP